MLLLPLPPPSSFFWLPLHLHLSCLSRDTFYQLQTIEDNELITNQIPTVTLMPLPLILLSRIGTIIPGIPCPPIYMNGNLDDGKRSLHP